MKLWQIALQCLLVLAVMVAQGAAGASTLDDTVDITSLQFQKSETLASTTSHVYHMELDLYKDDGRILFSENNQYLKSTDGKTTEVAASGFSNAIGFKQLNSTHVAVVNRGQHCIKMVNREEKSKEVLAGTCGSHGTTNGASGRFYNPWGVELDERNPGYLLITDESTNLLRSVDITSGVVSTIISTGFSYPKGLTWYNDRLLVCNNHYISEVRWNSNGGVTNYRLAGSTSYAYSDGVFSSARFSYPYDIQQLRDGVFLVADYSNKKLRLLNMFKKKVLPVCIGSTSCTTSTSLSVNPDSLLISNDTVYYGGSRKIVKLTGRDLQCTAPNKTAYVYPDKTEVPVRLDDNDFGKFPPGEYKFWRSYEPDACSYYVVSLESPIVRTAAFRAEYNDIDCSTLNNHLTKAFFSSILAHRKDELQKLCGKTCKMSTTLKPWYKCTDKLLQVTWPMEAVFPVDVKDVPTSYKSPIVKLLNAPPTYSPEMIVLTHIPPVVKPKRSSKGELVQVVLASSCSDDRKTYRSNYDDCV